MSRKFTKMGSTPLALPYYIGVQQLVRSSTNDNCLLSAETVCYSVYGEISKYRLKETSEVLSELEEVVALDNNLYSSSRDKYYSKDFTIISSDEFTTIIRSGKKNASALLQHFVRLVRSFDYNIEIDGRNNIVGHMPISYFIESYGLSKNTIMNYNKALEELSVIYIEHGTDNKNNLYCRYKDRSLVESRFHPVESANFHRSVSARYNRYLRDPGVFSAEEVKALYDDCVKYNEDMDNIRDSSKKKELDKIKTT